MTMKKAPVALALALSLAASGALAKDKPTPRMKAETIAAYSTQNHATQDWLPIAILMLLLVGLFSGSSSYMVPA